MYLVYEFFLLLFCIIYLPYYLVKRKFHEGFLVRLGFLTDNIETQLRNKKYIWIHAVSVGEAIAASRLIPALRNKFAIDNLVISTVTATGNRIARSIAKDEDLVIYLPLDFGFIMERTVKIIRPILFITTETEIWPNLIKVLKKNSIPVALINGRISDNSFKNYKLVKFFLKRILDKMSIFCMRTKSDAERIIMLGAEENKVKITGNMKFDDTPVVEHSYDLSDLDLRDDEQLLIAGSTHPQEEEMIIYIYKNLIAEFPKLKLLIAPRHLERLKEIENIIIKNGFRVSRFSEVKLNTKQSENYIILLDTMGQLKSIYNIATVVFVGGSLVNKGGHNIIEPANFSKPIIFGSFMHNFQDIADLFVTQNAAVKVLNKEELEISLRTLLRDKDLRDKIGNNARVVVQDNKGATAKTLEILKDFIKI